MSPADLTATLEELHAAAFGWALSCCGWDRSAAEDVLQATYLKLLDGRARFDGRSTFRTFVFGVIARTAREARRRTALRRDRKSTRLNSSHGYISYAVFCLKKKEYSII